MEYKSVESRFLEPTKRAMIIFGQDSKVFKPVATFLKVQATQDYEVPNIITGFTPIAPGSTLDYNILTHAEILGGNNPYLEQVPADVAATIVRHMGIGVSPGYMNVFVEFPKGTKYSRPFNLNVVGTSKPYGFFRAWQSPEMCPTEKGEFLIPYGMLIALGFKNVGLHRAAPRVRLVFRDYYIRVLDRDNPQDAKEISEMARGRGVFIKQMGDLISVQAMASELSKSWKDPILLDEALALGGGN